MMNYKFFKDQKKKREADERARKAEEARLRAWYRRPLKDPDSEGAHHALHDMMFDLQNCYEVVKDNARRIMVNRGDSDYERDVCEHIAALYLQLSHEGRELCKAAIDEIPAPVGYYGILQGKAKPRDR